MEKKFITKNSNETIKLGIQIGMNLKAGDVVLLEGDLAAGKTTLTKGIGLAQGVEKVINSPTFTIVKKYIGKTILYHLDLYRLNGVNNDFDLEEYIEGDGIAVIEWPTQAKELIPDNYLLINIKNLEENIREISVTGKGKRYTDIVKRLELCIQ